MKQFKKFSNRVTQLLLIIIISTTGLTACVEALIAGAAIATVDIIHDRRTVGEYVDDTSIELTIQNYIIANPSIRNSTHIKAVSWNGILLVTGEIDTEETKQVLMTKIQTIAGIRQVVDESTITGKTALLARTNDAWISTKVKSQLLLKTGLDANRVKVITTRGSVYLMGIVTSNEAMIATDLARNVKGVARVIKVFEYKEYN